MRFGGSRYSAAGRQVRPPPARTASGRAGTARTLREQATRQRLTAAPPVPVLALALPPAYLAGPVSGSWWRRGRLRGRAGPHCVPVALATRRKPRSGRRSRADTACDDTASDRIPAPLRGYRRWMSASSQVPAGTEQSPGGCARGAACGTRVLGA